MDKRGAHVTRVLDDEDVVAGGVVRRYLEQEPALAARLTAEGIPVVVFVPDVHRRTELVPDYFERVQASLNASVGKHGRALYVASVHARPLILAAKPLPRLDARPGVFVGYFAVGEGGAVFVQPSGELGAKPALFIDAIGAMMTGYR